MYSDRQSELARMDRFTKVHDMSQFYEDNSEDQSLFHVRASSHRKEKTIQIIFGKRLIGRYNFWRMTEMKLYIEFLKEFLGLFERQNKLRLRLRAYHLMSDYLKTKSYSQCRLYHFRMMRRFGTLDRIIEMGEGKLNRRDCRSEKTCDYGGLRVCLDEISEPQDLQSDDIWEVMGSQDEERLTKEPLSSPQ